MKLKLYQVDAFADKIFKGNPAAVCPLDAPLPDELMQTIAAENNQPATAYYVKTPAGYYIRWFNPVHEIMMCGHATLATSHVLFTHEGFNGNELHLESGVGPLKVTRNNGWITLDFPTNNYAETELTEDLKNAFNHVPLKALKGTMDYMLVYENESDIATLIPNLRALAQLDCRGVIVTAPGHETDFVSRFLGQDGVEDAVTGSAHTFLTPYWASVLGKDEFTARQLSARGGYLKCRLMGNRTLISGQAVTYMKGEIEV